MKTKLIKIICENCNTENITWANSDGSIIGKICCGKYMKFKEEREE